MAWFLVVFCWPLLRHPAVAASAPAALWSTWHYLATFEAEVDFLCDIGKTYEAQIFNYWRDQLRGYLLADLPLDGQWGVPLRNDLYQWTFRLRCFS